MHVKMEAFEMTIRIGIRWKVDAEPSAVAAILHSNTYVIQLGKEDVCSGSCKIWVPINIIYVSTELQCTVRDDSGERQLFWLLEQHPPNNSDNYDGAGAA